MPGARAALCLAVQPFGALSLRSAVPFALEGALGFYIRGNGATSPAALGALEMQVGAGGGRWVVGSACSAGAPCPPPPLVSLCMAHIPNPLSASPCTHTSPQFESSSPSRYAITRSITLAEALAAQAVAEGRPAAAAEAQLAGIAAGEWVPVKVPLAAFEGQPGFKADRWTLGSCLQRLEGCSSAAPALELCLDQASLGPCGLAEGSPLSGVLVHAEAAPTACQRLPGCRPLAHVANPCPFLSCRL